MRKAAVCTSVVAATALVIACALPGLLVTTADAFEMYSTGASAGNCADCHGDFRLSPYTPLAAARQGVSWATDLHNAHRNAATATPPGLLNGNCDACHSGSGRFPVLLAVSDAATPFNQSCSGCHDGPGLRNHHMLLAGVAGTADDCTDCHGVEGVGNEQSPLPPVYTAALGTTTGTTRINNPCDDGAAGTVFEGSFFDVLTIGLDNDGDGLYDQDDPDCQAVDLCAGSTPTACTVDGQLGACAVSLTVCDPATGAITCPQTVTPVAETCNGTDDDCDGSVDNIASAACSTGLQGVCGDGTTVCAGGALVCSQNLQPTAEVCDGLDNDCDGQVDDAIASAVCTTGLPGICADGTTACVNAQSVCNQTTPAGTEGPFPANCTDGLDNDCDALSDSADPSCALTAEADCFDGIDNNSDGLTDCADPTCADTQGPATSCGVGACAAIGTRVCQGGVEVSSCVPGPPAAELCDSIDNDCDGQVDDGIVPLAITCGTGICLADGQSVCVGGAFVDTCTPGAPGIETCNNLDDDCDGAIDNIAGVPTTCGVGACANTGQMICQNGAPLDTCTPLSAGTEGPFGDPTCSDMVDNDCDSLVDAADQGCSEVCVPGIEICDGLDNDCNGLIDDGIAPVDITCGVGVCLSSGQRVCVNGAPADQCTPLPAGVEGPFGDLTCADGSDNNCDGFTDAADPNCAPVCVPAQEVCDGVDNDCDGVSDNNIATMPTTCGIGACVSTGALECVNGQFVDGCMPLPADVEQFGAASTCSDNIDNDCDALVDAADPGCTAPPVEQACFDGQDNDGDGFIDCADPDCAAATDGTCDTGLAGSCAAGQVQCVNGAAACVQLQFPQSEVCTDGIDNDCDGFTDVADPDCQVPAVDFDFETFHASPKIDNCSPPKDKDVKLFVVLQNESSSPACFDVTVVGAQSDAEIYREVMNVCLNGGQETRVVFPEPSLELLQLGTIDWTATIGDGNADVDLSTEKTKVVCQPSKKN